MGRTLDVAIAEAAACTRCGLAGTRTQVVYGVGPLDAELMIVGEAPGRDEDLQGEPFVGRAGQLLTDVLDAAGLARGGVYIANVLKCRPPGNRDPLPDEIDACRPWLEEQMELVDPRLVVTLGNFSTKLLLGTTIGITRLRGKTYRFGDRLLLPTFHPSAALRSGPNGATTEQLRRDIAFAAEVLVKLRTQEKGSPAPPDARTEEPAAGLVEGRLF